MILVNYFASYTSAPDFSSIHCGFFSYVVIDRAVVAGIVRSYMHGSIIRACFVKYPMPCMGFGLSSTFSFYFFSSDFRLGEA